MPRILIIDDDPSVRRSIAMILRYERFETAECPTGPGGLAAVTQDPGIDVVLLDVKMPDMDGLECLTRIREARPDLPVVMISGHGTVETAVDAVKRGAFDFLEKPLDRERVILTVRHAADAAGLARETARLRDELLDRWRLHGSSAVMEQLRATIRRVAPTDARVLITGENGTGKELVARNLHALSGRSRGPFVDVNCAAIPRELIESELFGHEKGAFTGASALKIGKFEQADGGTIFLDEIGDMDPAAQAKVLRVLEQGRIERVGGARAFPVDVRVLAATNKDLEAAVAEGTFREDLLYRLNVIPIRVPSLRERAEDIPELFERFLLEACRRHDIPPRRPRADLLEVLKRRSFPGNVRELRNLAERIALLAGDDDLGADAALDLATREARLAGDSVFDCRTFEEFREASERLFLERKLRENDWNIRRTAEAIGMQRSNLYRKIERLKLK